MKKNHSVPETRPQVLLHILRDRWVMLCCMSMLMLLFAIPLVAAGLLGEFGKASELMELNGVDAVICCFRWDLLQLAMMVPGALILATGLSGVCYILQLLAWGEGVIFRQDFVIGIRENGKSFLLASLFALLSYFSVQCNADLVTFAEEEPLTLVISSVLSGLASFLLATAAVYIAAQALQYRVKLSESIKNGLILCVAYFPRNLLLMLMIAGPVILCAALGIGARLVWLGVLGLFGFSFIALVTILVCNRIFDQAVNERMFPDRVGRGLAKHKDDQN